MSLRNNYFHYWVDSKKDEEIKKFQECIDSYIYFKKDSFLITNQLIRENRNFQAPKLLKAFLLLFSRDINKLTLAKDTIKSISVDNINNHFHKYLEVAKLWINNDLKNLLNKLELIIKENPKDIFAIRLFHFNNIFVGIDGKFLDKHEEILSKWSENDQHYNLLLGMTSYAYEENNLIDKAKFLAINSLKQSSNDLWSWHALLHVHDNENNDSINKNDNFNKINWSIYGPIKRHIWWHQSLILFYNQEYEKSLKLFDKYFSSSQIFYLDFCNACSFLLRLHYKGVDVRDRMDKLKDYAEYFKNQHVLPFIDYHLIFYYSYYNDQGYFEQLENRMEENYLENSFKENYINFLKPIIKNMKTHELLNENIIKSQFKYLGGSFAQRELIFLSLIQNTKYEKNKSNLISEYNNYKSVSKLYV
ncbi:hypothetical protein OA258_02025 [Pelagibacteraceae bacterium]|nr:hypothetical protein [Pelagibacteraceae bacterium]